MLAEILDRHTTEVLVHAGVRPGWRCLYLGAGAGTIAAWLAQRVGPNGRVVAVDADPRHIRRGDLIDVRAQDVATTDLGAAEYDLVHAQLLAMHRPQREDLIARWTEALRPGGTLVVSGRDCGHVEDLLLQADGRAAKAFATFQDGVVELGADRRLSPGWARGWRVPRG